MFRISFDFNEVTEKVTNIVVEKDGNLKTTKKKIDNSKPLVEIDSNKLVISTSALDLIGAEYGDRIGIQYYSKNNTETFPLIAKASEFSDENSGNKLTKSNTVSFKGKQREILCEYGTLFTLEEFSPMIYKLVPLNDGTVSADESVNSELEQEQTDLNQLEKILDEEIENFNSQNIDELPF